MLQKEDQLRLQKGLLKRMENIINIQRKEISDQRIEFRKLVHSLVFKVNEQRAEIERLKSDHFTNYNMLKQNIASIKQRGLKMEKRFSVYKE